MRIAELIIHHVQIPLRRRVSHASFSRDLNDSLIARCKLSTGETGWGEGLPRPYVTGESIDAVWDLLGAIQLAPLTADCREVGHVVHVMENLQLPRVPGQRDCFGNSVRCAIELAILDAFLRAFQTPLRGLIPMIPQGETIFAPRDSVRYSGVITSTRPIKAMSTAGLYRLTGFVQCKLKVGTAGIDDRTLVKQVRRALGNKMDLRIDANEAWSAEQLIEKVTPLLDANLTGIEQPVPHGQISQLKEIKQRIPVPIILDESLCSMSDADAAIAEGWGEVFNVRLSKCGGFIPSVKLVALASQSGRAAQLGCQVGETGILSAAGRHFATGVSGLRYLEGSFDRFLVREKLTREDLTFGWGGGASAIHRPGLGVTMNELALQRVTLKSSKLL